MSDLLRPADPHGTARDRFDIHRPRIHAIASLLTKGQPVDATDSEIAAVLGMKRAAVAVTRRLMIHIGALETVSGDPYKPSGWRLLLTGQELDRAIDLEMERQMRGGMAPEAARKKLSLARGRRRLTRRSQERVAVTEDRLGFAVAAVVGPDRPEPLRTSLVGSGPNAPAALVMAAKQYASGQRDTEQRKALELVKQLAEIGVAIPKELADKAKPHVDQRLEAIRLVLPYIEDLERQLVTAKDQLRSQADYGDLRQRVEKQRSQIERLVADRTAGALGQRPHQS